MALYHMANGNVGYTVVGSPTITDGVASGFTRNDSLRTSQSFTDSGQDFSMQFSIENFTQATDINPIVSNYESSIGGNYFAIVINSPGASSYPNGFSARIKGNALAVQSAHTIDYTKSYRLLFQRVSGVYTLKVYQDGTLVDTQQLVSSELLAGGAAFTFNIGANNYWFPVGFSGSIDLKKTYIQSNGQPWFGSSPIEVKKHRVMGPVGYTVVGSPTIMDGIISGTNASNYAQAEQPLILTPSSDFELYTRFKSPDIIPTNGQFQPIGGAINGANPLIYVYSGWVYCFVKAFPDWVWRVMQAATVYRVRIKAKAGTWTATVYDDTGAILGEKVTTPTFEETTLTVLFGKAAGYDDSFPVPAFVDLNETWIKQNGKLWYWQPRETERIVANGVEVWTKPV